MADLTVSMACLPQNINSLNKVNNSKPCCTHSHSRTTGSCSTLPSSISHVNHTHGNKVGVDDAVCSKLCERHSKPHNSTLENEAADFVAFTKGTELTEGSPSIQNCIIDDHCVCALPTVHSLNHKSKCIEKVNGLNHIYNLPEHSHVDNSLCFDVRNTCKGATADTEIHTIHHHHSHSHCGSKSTQAKSHDCASKSCEVLCSHKHGNFDELLTDLENISIEQPSSSSEQHTSSNNMINGVDYVVYESEKQMQDIMRLITKDLSEPYSIYTYRYFIHNWPKLCFLAMCDGKCVGAIVCKLDLHKKMVRRGYIAMLAIDSDYRRRKIGSTLVTKAIEAMIRDDCDEVVLETEITNKSALHLYENLGFVRDKRLFRYYLNGVDALRLKLWLR